jgi:hypothetical protein
MAGVKKRLDRPRFNLVQVDPEPETANALANAASDKNSGVLELRLKDKQAVVGNNADVGLKHIFFVPRRERPCALSAAVR